MWCTKVLRTDNWLDIKLENFYLMSKYKTIKMSKLIMKIGHWVYELYKKIDNN